MSADDTRGRRIRIGLLYSTTGTYRVLGEDASNAALLAVDNVNASPRYDFQFEVHAENPAGELDGYRAGCERLIRAHGIQQIFGCITSSSRKEIIPLIEKHDAQLWYCIPYEGFESADNVFYTGACPNQHILPLFRYLLPRYGTNICCIGSNYIWAWENSRLARSIVTAAGGSVVSDRYLALGTTDVERFIEEIADIGPDFVFCNLVGESAHAFYRAFHAAGLGDPARHPHVGPVVSCDLTEPDLAAIGYPAALGILNQSVWFQSIETAASRAFVGRYQDRFGADSSVSAMGAVTYASVFLLAEALREQPDASPETLRRAVYSAAVEAPFGTLRIDPDNNHAYLTPMLGRSVPGARFETIAAFDEPVKPDPFLAWDDERPPMRELPACGGVDRHLRVVK